MKLLQRLLLQRHVLLAVVALVWALVDLVCACRDYRHKKRLYERLQNSRNFCRRLRARLGKDDKAHNEEIRRVAEELRRLSNEPARSVRDPR